LPLRDNKIDDALFSVLPYLATSSEFGYFSGQFLTKNLHWLLLVLATFLATFENVEILPKKCKFCLKSVNLGKFLNLKS